MANPMDIALWHDREGGFAVLWSRRRPRREIPAGQAEQDLPPVGQSSDDGIGGDSGLGDSTAPDAPQTGKGKGAAGKGGETADKATARSEEHTSELQSLMRISYAVFCLKKKKNQNDNK